MPSGRLILDPSAVLGGKYSVEGEKGPVDFKPFGPWLVAETPALHYSHECARFCKLVWCRPDGGRQEGLYFLDDQKARYVVTEDVTAIFERMQVTARHAERTREAEAMAARSQGAIAAGFASIQSTLTGVAAAPKELASQLPALREDILREVRKSLELSDKKTDEAMRAMQAMLSEVVSQIRGVKNIMPHQDTLQALQQAQATQVTKLDEALAQQLAELKKQQGASETAHQALQRNIDKTLTAKLQEVVSQLQVVVEMVPHKASQKSMDERLTAKLQEVSSSLDATLEKHASQARTWQDALQGLQQAQGKQAMTFDKALEKQLEELKTCQALQKTMDERLTTKLQEVSESLDATLEKHAGQARTLQETLESLQESNRQLGKQLSQDVSKKILAVESAFGQDLELNLKPLEDLSRKTNRMQSDLQDVQSSVQYLEEAGQVLPQTIAEEVSSQLGPIKESVETLKKGQEAQGSAPSEVASRPGSGSGIGTSQGE